MSRDSKLSHARFTMPELPGELPAKHPFKNRTTHNRLLEYLQERMLYDLPNRDNRVERYSQIDRDVAAYLRLDDEDKKRADEHARTGNPQATKISLPLSFVHLDDMMTYYAQTFAPNRGMFYHTADKETSPEATQLVALMNNHATQGGYYRQLLRSIYSILKYNAGGVINSWDTEYGPKLQATAQGTTALTQVPVFKGNRIKSADMYNFFFDPSVELVDLHKDGEWCAWAEIKSHYWLKSRCLAATFFNCADILEGERESGLATRYYKDPPAESRLSEDESAKKHFSWFSFMAGTAENYALNGAFEITTIYIRLNPNDFNLIPAREGRNRQRYEIWRFTLLNDERIIECQYMNNVHNHLPAYFGTLNDDVMRDVSKSVAEILNPLQQFASFLLNTHVLANRKNIFGTTYYDPSCVDYGAMPAGEVAGRVPLKPPAWGKDIRTMIYHDTKTLDTKQTLQDMQGVMGIIDQFFPTQSLPSQIAGIDRAVDSQVAAVQQGSNRRQHKGARLIDDTMLRPMRFGMYYNIVQYQADGEDIADFYSGASVKIDLSKLRDMNLALIIGQGLKALDRQAIQTQLREIIFAMIQAPQISERVDLLGLLDYWTTMMDLDMNLKQFELAPPPAAAAPGVPGAEGAAGTGIVPATSPENITGGPIYA